MNQLYEESLVHGARFVETASPSALLDTASSGAASGQPTNSALFSCPFRFLYSTVLALHLSMFDRSSNDRAKVCSIYYNIAF